MDAYETTETKRMTANWTAKGQLYTFLKGLPNECHLRRVNSGKQSHTHTNTAIARFPLSLWASLPFGGPWWRVERGRTMDLAFGPSVHI